MEWRIHVKEVTASTNEDALGGAHGDVFAARLQTAGRGRGAHTWEGSSGKSLAMSAVLRVSCVPPAYAATLPLVAGLAVLEALRKAAGRSLPEAGVKWPNDVLVAGKKIAGILCRRDGDNVIVGIGVNVKKQDFSGDVAQRAVSLEEAGVDVSVDGFRDIVLGCLRELYGEWIERGSSLDGGEESSKMPESIFLKLRAADLLKNRRVRLMRLDGDPQPLEGDCGGIAPDGSLLVAGERVWAGEAVACDNFRPVSFSFGFPAEF